MAVNLPFSTPRVTPVQGLHLTGAMAEGFGEIGNGDNVHARLPHSRRR